MFFNYQKNIELIMNPVNFMPILEMFLINKTLLSTETLSLFLNKMFTEKQSFVSSLEHETAVKAIAIITSNVNVNRVFFIIIRVFYCQYDFKI